MSAVRARPMTKIGHALSGDLVEVGALARKRTVQGHPVAVPVTAVHRFGVLDGAPPRVEARTFHGERGGEAGDLQERSVFGFKDRATDLLLRAFEVEAKNRRQ